MYISLVALNGDVSDSAPNMTFWSENCAIVQGVKEARRDGRGNRKIKTSGC